MADETVNQRLGEAEARRASEKRASEPHFKAFQTYRDEVARAQLPGAAVCMFAERVGDIVRGVAAVVDLVMDDDSRRDLRQDADEPTEEFRPLLSREQLWDLQRMARAALLQIDSDSNRLVEWAYEYHTPEGIAERTARSA